MKLLKNNGHLFANRKFKIKIETEHGYVVHKINGIWLYGTILDHPEKCTLVARPISDMTDSELAEYKNTDVETLIKHTDVDYEKKKIIQLANEDDISFRNARKLLSFGILPFPQSLFKDGTVLSHSDIQNQEPKNPPRLNHRMFG